MAISKSASRARTVRAIARQPRGDNTRKAILDSAERIFADFGYSAARLEDVAEDVGIRRPSIVYYFPGKQQLYDEVESRIFTSMHEFVEKRLTSAQEPMARLLTLLDAWLDFLVGRPTAARIIQRLVADHAPRGDNPVEFSDLALRDLEIVLTAGIADGSFRPVSPMHFINAVSAGSLFYVCNSTQLGRSRNYRADDPNELEAFRALQHKLAKTAVAPD